MIEQPSYAPRPLSSDDAIGQAHQTAIGRSNQRGRSADSLPGSVSAMPSKAATKQARTARRGSNARNIARATSGYANRIIYEIIFIFGYIASGDGRSCGWGRSPDPVGQAEELPPRLAEEGPVALQRPIFQ